jgi:hypothetical protein
VAGRFISSASSRSLARKLFEPTTCTIEVYGPPQLFMRRALDVSTQSTPAGSGGSRFDASNVRHRGDWAGSLEALAGAVEPNEESLCRILDRRKRRW